MTLSELSKFSMTLHDKAKTYIETTLALVNVKFQPEHYEMPLYGMFNFAFTREGHNYWQDLSNVKTKEEFEKWEKFYIGKKKETTEPTDKRIMYSLARTITEILDNDPRLKGLDHGLVIFVTKPNEVAVISCCESKDKNVITTIKEMHELISGEITDIANTPCDCEECNAFRNLISLNKHLIKEAIPMSEKKAE